jgi:hypothetical protein
VWDKRADASSSPLPAARRGHTRPRANQLHWGDVSRGVTRRGYEKAFYRYGACWLMTIVSTPLNYLPSLFSSPGIGTELRLSVPQNYPPIGGLVVTLTVTGTNVYLLDR